MGTVVWRTRIFHDGMSELQEQVGDLLRGFTTARDADRAIWRRIGELEREVAELKSDRDARRVELASLWREVDDVRRSVSGIRGRG